LDLKKDQASAISLVATLARTSEPLPAEIAQRDDQYLQWTTNTTYVPSWYPTTVERIKVRYVSSLIRVLLCPVSCALPISLGHSDAQLEMIPESC
jgi:oligosaccharyltransferase complex subunit alpha (ribophorin I)